jgi:hypothetical protein
MRTRGDQQLMATTSYDSVGAGRRAGRCAALGIAETSTVVDGTVIRPAAADVVTLWPWSPPDHDRPPPPVPDLPPGSWFSDLS